MTTATSTVPTKYTMPVRPVRPPGVSRSHRYRWDDRRGPALREGQLVALGKQTAAEQIDDVCRALETLELHRGIGEYLYDLGHRAAALALREYPRSLVRYGFALAHWEREQEHDLPARRRQAHADEHDALVQYFRARDAMTRARSWSRALDRIHLAKQQGGSR